MFLGCRLPRAVARVTTPGMREKELRLALVCYGGISLAVWMHGITREVWHLARASRGFIDGARPASAVERVYADLLDAIAQEGGTRLRVLVDIVAGSSAGGINAVFLGHAIATGRSLDPLTMLWLDKADLEALMDPAALPGSRVTKMWAAPLAWAMAGREAGLDGDGDGDDSVRDEVRAKLARFVRSRWFEPPFSGTGFDHLMLDAFDAIDAGPAGAPLLPDGHPLDLFVTVTEFDGHPERLRLNSPAEVVETEHRLTIAFTDRGRGPRSIGDPAGLTFAARATASFPGAFPPFTAAELDAVLDARRRAWPGRDDFLARVLPRQAAAGRAAGTVLLDGSVLANAPFHPAMAALRNRPARREIDRRFVYVDPHPGTRMVRLAREREGAPGFVTTILASLSDIPREQPIRDTLEAIGRRSDRIARIRAVTDRIAPDVERAVEDALGRTFALNRPTAARLSAWRDKANDRAVRGAGFAYTAYGQLRRAGVADELATLLHGLADDRVREARAYRDAVERRLGADATDEEVFAAHDLRFRVRRLRFVARTLERMEQAGEIARDDAQALRDAVFAALTPYLARGTDDVFAADTRAAAAATLDAPADALAAIAAARDLAGLDAATDGILADALRPLARGQRRPLLFAYLGYAFFDIATLPLTQGEGLDEFDPVLVDRISPDDAPSIREGGAAATLKGVQFNGFGAFFSRAYRENDYLWGRLHGAERLIEIVASALAPGRHLPPGRLAGLKRAAFRAVLEEERDRLGLSAALIAAIKAELG